MKIRIWKIPQTWVKAQTFNPDFMKENRQEDDFNINQFFDPLENLEPLQFVKSEEEKFHEIDMVSNIACSLDDDFGAEGTPIPAEMREY